MTHNSQIYMSTNPEFKSTLWKNDDTTTPLH
jgi:hypothetical protein